MFVPIDTSMNSTYFTDLLRTGLFNRAVLEYVDGNRKRLDQKYADRAAFIAESGVEQALLDGLIALGESEDIPFVEADWTTSYRAIELRLKAILARTLFDTTAFYEVFNPINPIYNRGLEVLRDGTYKASGVSHR